jgi:hypothetical protein
VLSTCLSTRCAALTSIRVFFIDLMGALVSVLSVFTGRYKDPVQHQQRMVSVLTAVQHCCAASTVPSCMFLHQPVYVYISHLHNCISSVTLLSGVNRAPGVIS